MKQVFIESDISSFEDFHDGEWFEKLFEASEQTLFHQHIEEFAAHWWGASRAFTLPRLLVISVGDAAGGYELHGKTNEQLWSEYLQIKAFKGALWKTAESTYCSIYYAYENLVVNIISQLSNKYLRVTDRNFNSMVSEILGASTAGKVWNNSKISAAKEIRNCLVHNGGKATPALKRIRPTPLIENENVLISASDARKLHAYLKPKVVALITSNERKS
ncbi:MAG: hypothetical protein KZQ89_15615 [Candidatus Thiodiazotropha sp. (ex Lucinoma kastoroae)]|nr:hypothetical protein [Candidatus Thiodiazotropha sp. (ex Lucinoma kastoroae)]MCU7861835.1 hypothetical protein [Candidatus Thiodiazotropha sp. (ex Lucinoma kastoroae)]